MICFIENDYDVLLDIIFSLEDKINYLEFNIVNDLNNTIHQKNKIIDLLETKLQSEFAKTLELKSYISSLETKIINRNDEILSLTYQLKNATEVKPISFSNEIIKFFEEKLEIEFDKNDKMRAEIALLQEQLKQKDDEIYSLTSCNYYPTAIPIQNDIMKLFDDKLNTEFETNLNLKWQISVLEAKMKEKDNEIYSFKNKHDLDKLIFIKMVETLLILK